MTPFLDNLIGVRFDFFFFDGELLRVFLEEGYNPILIKCRQDSVLGSLPPAAFTLAVDFASGHEAVNQSLRSALAHADFLLEVFYSRKAHAVVIGIVG